LIPLKDNVPTRTFPFVTVGLIVACFLVWFWELSNPGVDVHVFRDGFYPCAVQGPCRLPPGFHTLPWYEGVFTGYLAAGIVSMALQTSARAARSPESSARTSCSSPAPAC
jgi:hypothetical protein